MPATGSSKVGALSSAEQPPRVITLDFETYYDEEYSLSKMPTAQYIFDPRFTVLMAGVKVNSGPVTVLEGNYTDMCRQLTSLLHGCTTLVCHNAMFDASVLAWHYGIHVPNTFCTWMAGQAIVGPFLKSVSLASLSQFFSLGIKGDELVRTKGKRRSDFSDMEWEAFMSYCANDVELTYKLFRVFKGWMGQNVVNVA